MVASLQDRDRPEEPVDGSRRRRRLATALIVFVLAAAMVATGLYLTNDGEVAAPGPTTTEAPTTTEPEPEPEPTTTAPEGIPAGFVEYNDPQDGFAVALPEGFTVDVDPETHLTQATAGDTRIAVRWLAPAVDPLAFLGSERDRLAAFPRYQEIAFDDQPFGDFPGGFWEFEFAQNNDPDLLLQSTGRVFTVGQGDAQTTYAVFFRGPAEEFEQLQTDVFSVVEESFQPLRG
jgi:hypothetical protein